jgi:hypothetical protein
LARVIYNLLSIEGGKMPDKRSIYAPHPVNELASNFPVYSLCPACKHFEIKETQVNGYKFRCYGGGENSNTAFAKALKDNYDSPQEQNNCEKYERIIIFLSGG